VTCPVCETNLRFFLPFGVGGRIRSGALCPQCRSLERDRAAWLILRSPPSRLKPKMGLLHVAPERCLEPRLRESLGAGYVTGDLVRHNVDRNFSVEALPFADGAFDAVICNHVLEHVNDDRKAMRELRRVLAPGGWALLQVPLRRDLDTTLEDATVTSPRQRRIRFGQHDHVRWYGHDYVARLREAGFEPAVSRVRDGYTPAEILRYGLDPDEAVHLCNVR
jgi:SAM-dependent methyltransferase